MGDWNREEIVTALKVLESLDPQHELFGYPSQHGYKLNPPAEEAEIDQFEKRHGITLPREYRDFLTTVGTGGFGPAYGIHSLGKSEAQLASCLEALEINPDGFLATPFPKPTGLDEAPEYYIAPGMLPICHLGSGLYIHLCVSGPERGYLWSYDNDTFRPVYNRDDEPAFSSMFPPEAEIDEWTKFLYSEKNTYRIGFQDWYLNQLSLLRRNAEAQRMQQPALERPVTPTHFDFLVPVGVAFVLTIIGFALQTVVNYPLPSDNLTGLCWFLSDMPVAATTRILPGIRNLPADPVRLSVPMFFWTLATLCVIRCIKWAANRVRKLNPVTVLKR